MNNEYKQRCPSISKCNAPICPGLNNSDCIWYPNEEICRRRCYASLKWIRKQKKIAKKTIYQDLCFSKNDIEQIKRITVKTKGRNPDKETTQCPIKNYAKFNKKPIANGGICDATTPSTYQTLTNNLQQVKPPFRRVLFKT